MQNQIPKLIHTIDLDHEYPAGSFVFCKGNQVLAKLRFHEIPRGNAGHRIQTGNLDRSGLPSSPFRGRAILLKTLCCSDHRATVVEYGIRPKNDGNPIPVLVKAGTEESSVKSG